MAGTDGFEPPLVGSEPTVLTIGRSPKRKPLLCTSLCGTPDIRAGAVILNLTTKWSGARDLNSHLLASEARFLPLEEPPMVGKAGLEPTLACFQSRREIRFSTSR